MITIPTHRVNSGRTPGRHQAREDRNDHQDGSDREQSHRVAGLDAEEETVEDTREPQGGTAVRRIDSTAHRAPH